MNLKIGYNYLIFISKGLISSGSLTPSLIVNTPSSIEASLTTALSCKANCLKNFLAAKPFSM